MEIKIHVKQSEWKNGCSANKCNDGGFKGIAKKIELGSHYMFLMLWNNYTFNTRAVNCGHSHNSLLMYHYYHLWESMEYHIVQYWWHKVKLESERTLLLFYDRRIGVDRIIAQKELHACQSKSIELNGCYVTVILIQKMKNSFFDDVQFNLQYINYYSVCQWISNNRF